MQHYARRVTQQLEEAAEALTELKDASRGRLQLTMISTAKYFAPKFVARFCRLHPGVTLKLDVCNRATLLQHLARNETDLVIMGHPPQGLDLTLQPFAPNPHVIVAAPEHALARAHRENRGKSMTDPEAVALVEAKRRARALRAAGLDSGAVRDSLRAWQQRGPKATLPQVADHIEHIRDVAGVDHAGLGSDFDGISTVPVGLEDVSKFPDLLAELLRRGWSEQDVKKVAGLNALRVLRAAERVAAEMRRGSD